MTKYLEKDQYLVKKNKIVIEDPQISKDDPDLKYNLESLVLQKPNRHFFFASRAWYYFRYKEKYDLPGKKKGLANLAEPPVIFEDQSMWNSAERMEKYLRFSKGYYNAKVYPQAFLSDKRSEVHFHINTNELYTVKSKEYFCEDKRVMDIVDHFESKSLINIGTPIDESIFEEEKLRLVNLFQERGFAGFSKTHLEFKADSSNLAMDIFVTILPPANDSIHRRYTIGKITVYPDYRGEIKKSYANLQTIDNINFASDEEKYFIKPKTLLKSIQFNEGNFFRKEKLDDSYKSFSKLGTYRFIDFSSSISEETDTVINYDILLRPNEDILIFDGSWTLFYNHIQKQNINRVGMSVDPTLTNINIFRGGEKLSTSLEIGGEIVLGQSILSSAILKLGTELQYPSLKGHLLWISKASSIIPYNNKEYFQKLNNLSTSKLAMSYAIVQQLNEYQTNSINLKFSNRIKPNSKFTHTFTLTNLNSLSTIVDPDWRKEFLEDNPFLEKSFNPYLISGFLVQEYNYNLANPIFSSGFTWGMNLTVEQSGGEVQALNKIVNKFSNNPKTWTIPLKSGQIFEFSKYLLLDIDIRAKQVISNKHELAARFRSGIAYAYTKDGVIPFIKQFSVGGANSLRGWQTRELGPGSYADPKDTSRKSIFFQTGDFILEANLEYRFPIFGVFEGATFFDAGNIWTLNKKDKRVGSQLTKTFYNEIAVNTGVGIRINLDFLIIRLDFGYKIRYPYKNDDLNNKHWNIPEYNKSPNVVLGINYPF